MPSAATNAIGSGKSVPVISFAWGPKALDQYEGNPVDQYTYLWVATLNEDRRTVELYQAVDSSGQPWKAGSPTTGSDYALKRSLSIGTGKQISGPSWLGLTFSPSGKIRFALGYSSPTFDPPYGRIKFAIVKNDTIIPIFGVDVFRSNGDMELTGIVALNTYQLHGRLDQASTIAIGTVYNAEEDGTRFVTCNSVLEFMSPHVVSDYGAGPMGKKIRMLTRSTTVTSGYMTGKWYIVPANPIASPYGAMQVGGAGQLLAYNPGSGATRIISLKPTIPQGHYAPPVAIGQDGGALEIGGQAIGTPGLVHVGEQQYGKQGEGLKVRVVAYLY